MPRKRPLVSASPRCFSHPTRRRFLQGSAAVMAGIALSNCRQSPTDTLHIYTWANYTDDELIAQFTEKTGIPVVIDIYDSNEIMLAKLQAGGGDVYSLIYPSDYMVAEMLDLDLLMPLDLSRVQGMDNLFNKWQDPSYDPGNAHSIPFCWGTSGLLFNRELVSGDLEDWGYLWNNKEELARRITMLDDVRETMGAVLKSLGYSYNTTNPEEIEAAYNKLVELKPYLASFKTTGFEEELLGGDLTVSMSYSSDAIATTLEDDRMEYIVPASGTSLWTDTMAIPKTAPAVDAAYAWINFLLDPEVSKRTVERLYFATANQTAYDMLSDEVKSNTDLFPPAEVIDKCEGIAPVNDATDELYDRYWTEITST